MPHLSLALFGRFDVMLDGRPLTHSRTDKTLALLAYLAVEADRPHRRETLAALLWPDAAATAAHHNLSQSLLTLRKLLHDKTATPPFLLSTWKSVRFNPEADYTLDVTTLQHGVDRCLGVVPKPLDPARARALAEALKCYQGEFLCTPLQVDSLAFEDWLLHKQTQLHLLALDGLEDLVQYHARRGEYGLAAGYARRIISLEPLREAAHRKLMEVLALDGRGPEALAQYATCRDLLAREFNIAPAAETTALYEAIRAAGSAEPPWTAAAHPAPEHGRRGGNTLPLFVGRASELTRLAGALAPALAGEAQVVFVTGDAGSGKTALLEAFAHGAMAAHPDLLVVSGSGNAYTGLGDPYWPFVEMLRQLREATGTRAEPPDPAARRLAAARPILAPIMADAGPDLDLLLSGMAPAGVMPHGLCDRIARLLQAVAAQRPLLILLDDLQWADRESLNLLLHLGSRLTGQRLLIAGALRPDVLDGCYSPLDALREQDAGELHPLTVLVNELQRRLGATRIDLAQADGRAFVEALLEHEPNRLGTGFRETLYRQTEGHALLTVELLRGMHTRGELARDAQGYWIAGPDLEWGALPPRVEAVIAERIGGLPPAWRALLTVAAVEGDEFTLQVAARVQNMIETEVVGRLSGPLSRQHALVIPLGFGQAGRNPVSRYRFRHALFRGYLYSRLDPVERARLHLAVGDALEALYAERAHDIGTALARHFELGGHPDRAVPYLPEAGRRATQTAATEEAPRLHAHGLDLDPEAYRREFPDDASATVPHDNTPA